MGGEYNSKGFHSYYDKECIIHEVTNQYTLQHNGKVERRNKMLIHKDICMLKERNIPKQFWGKVVSIVTYCLSRSPTKNLHDVTL